MNIERAMASIRTVNKIEAIEGKDRIELAFFGLWQTIIKKGELKVGDLAVYFEIDSWIPTAIAPFLQKGERIKTFNNIDGNKLKSMKLGGVLSQGLALPLSILPEGNYEEGQDVTTLLGVQKWEKAIPVQLRGQVRSMTLPAGVRRTDQERIQNISAKTYEEYKNYTWEVTEKLHGSSCTFYLSAEGDFHVCSRNIDLKETAENTYWQVARKLKIEEKMREFDLFGYVLQGELCGPGINGNQYGLTEPEFFLFDVSVASPEEGMAYYRPSCHRLDLAAFVLRVLHSPVTNTAFRLPDNQSDLLQYTEGTSILNSSNREGLVFKCIERPDLSFKVVSNSWLLGAGED